MFNSNQFARAGSLIYARETRHLILDSTLSEEKAELICRVLNGFQMTINDREFTAGLDVGIERIRLTDADSSHLLKGMTAYALGVASSQAITESITQERDS